MKSEVKISIEGLEVGMYVSRLDRPWIKTPFELQGLNIKSVDDIEKLRKYCSYVYVDVEKGISPEPRFWVLRQGPRNYTQSPEKPRPTNSAKTRSARGDFTHLRKRSYTNTTRFEPELEVANDIYKDINADLTQILSDLKRGRDLDVETVKKGISVMTDSIIRNPAAMMWVINLRKMDDYKYPYKITGASRFCRYGPQLRWLVEK